MDFLQKICDAGVVGAGGAGFPTHVKLNASNIEYFIINAAECEPLLFTDKFIMKAYSEKILSAALACGEFLGAQKIIIAIKKNYIEEIDALQKEIDKNKCAISLHFLDNYYPAGDEQMIVFDITGRTTKPGGIPLSVGAIVNNVSTMLNCHEALLEKPVTRKILTVSGKINRPMILDVPIGITFQECIDFCGGASINRYKVINGGPMMGTIIDSEDASNHFVTKTTSGIILIDDDNLLVHIKERSLNKILNHAKSACIQCSFCTDLCPRKLIGHSINPHKIMRQFAGKNLSKMALDGIETNEIFKEALICCSCGICELYACPMGLAPQIVNSFIKKELSMQKIRYNAPNEKLTSFEYRDYRKISARSIMNRIGLADLYDIKPEGFAKLEADKVTIPLLQHVGSQSIPCVTDEKLVHQGDLIATFEKNKLGAKIHASISGIVKVLDKYIEIRKVSS